MNPGDQTDARPNVSGDQIEVTDLVSDFTLGSQFGRPLGSQSRGSNDFFPALFIFALKAYFEIFCCEVSYVQIKSSYGSSRALQR